MLCIIVLRGRFGGLLSPLVAFGGVWRTCDGCSFGIVFGKLPDLFRCIHDLNLVDRSKLRMVWRLHPFRFPTRGA